MTESDDCHPVSVRARPRVQTEPLPSYSEVPGGAGLERGDRVLRKLKGSLPTALSAFRALPARWPLSVANGSVWPLARAPLEPCRRTNRFPSRQSGPSQTEYAGDPAYPETPSGNSRSKF